MFDLDQYLSGLVPQPVAYPEPPTVPFQIGATAHLFVRYVVDEAESPWDNPNCQLPTPFVTEPVTVLFRVHYTNTDEYEYIVKTAAGEYKWVSHFNLYN